MPVGGPAFSSVRKARKALMAHAEEIYQQYRLLAKQAAASGDFETAEKIMWKLIEHMPPEEGEALVEVSIDKKSQIEAGKQNGPLIQIGVSIGGVQKQLPEAEPDEVIEVQSVPDPREV